MSEATNFTFWKERTNMNYIRQIINSDSLPPIFNLPKAMQNRQVEVIILPIEDSNINGKKSRSVRGMLKQYANPDLQQLESEAWCEEVKSKYETL